MINICNINTPNLHRNKVEGRREYQMDRSPYTSTHIPLCEIAIRIIAIMIHNLPVS